MVTPRPLAIVPPLARGAVDRDVEARTDPALFDRLLDDPRTRILPLRGDAAPMRGDRLTLLPVDQVTTARVRVYLGRNTDPTAPEAVGAPLILNVVSDAAFRDLSAVVEGWQSLREAAGGLAPRDAGLFAEALAVARWHLNYAYCPRCGMPTIVDEGGWRRRCPQDEYEVYPRIDPAVIMAVRDSEDRLLLGGGPDGWYSILAGFVEAGEPLESAVVREVREESGLNVHVESYLGSQAWPYPLSLMLAFAAVVDDPDPDAALHPDGVEISHLEWFTREDLLRRQRAMRLPGRASIARVMIESWLGEPLGAPTVEPPVSPEPNSFIAGTDVP